MKFFGREFRKSDNQPNLFRKSGGFFNLSGEAPETNIELYYDIFRRNSDVRACIREIQEGIAQEGWGYQRGEEIEYNIPVIDKILKNAQKIIKLIVRDVAIAGNCYLLKLKNLPGEVIGITTIDPRTIKIIADETGEVSGYLQVINGQVKKRYSKEEIVHCKDEEDPDNPVFGLSLLEGIIYDVLADKEAMLSNYYYFKNSAVPSLFIKAAKGVSDKEIKNTLKMMKSNFGGGKNKHKIGILQGIDGIERLQDNVSEMQFQILRGITTEKVCASIGVPKIVLNYTDNVNYTNAESQFKKFITQTIVNRENKIEEWMNQLLKDILIENGVTFKLFNATYSNDKEKVELLSNQISNGIITPNEARIEMGYEPMTGIPEADELLISKNMDKLRDIGLSDQVDTTGS